MKTRKTTIISFGIVTVILFVTIFTLVAFEVVALVNKSATITQSTNFKNGTVSFSITTSASPDLTNHK